MSKYLECDVCGRKYDDEGSIRMAENGREGWEELCRRDGVEPRGIAPCPVIPCTGELVLKEG